MYSAIALLLAPNGAELTLAQSESSPLPADSIHQLAEQLMDTQQQLRETQQEVALLRELQTQDSSEPVRLPLLPSATPTSVTSNTDTSLFVENADYRRVDTDVDNEDESCIQLAGFSSSKAGGWRVTPFGKLEAEAVFSTDLAVADNYIVFAAPRGFTKTERIDVTGQSTQVGLNIVGPRLGAFQVGGLILMDFHGNRPSRNEPGAYFIRGYGELTNENWRIAFGQMGDTIGGWNAETVNWPGVGGLGFLGANQRGTIRVDRYLYPSETAQWTITGALTQPVVTDLAGFQETVGQDNGLPNFECQLVLGLGSDDAGERPVQFSLSGLYGEFFAGAESVPNLPPNTTNTSQAYAIAGAMQLTGEFMGVRGQVWHGRGLGTYMGGISQSLNTENGESIRSSGGYCQVWLQLLSRLRVSMLAGIDDPRNGDLSTIVSDNQRVRNQLIGANAVVNVTDTLHFGMDVWSVQTDYVAPGNDNDIFVVMSEMSLAY